MVFTDLVHARDHHYGHEIIRLTLVLMVTHEDKNLEAKNHEDKN